MSAETWTPGTSAEAVCASTCWATTRTTCRRKYFIQAYGSRGIGVCHDGEARQQAAGMVAGARCCWDLTSFTAAWSREQLQGKQGLQLPKPTSSDIVPLWIASPTGNQVVRGLTLWGHLIQTTIASLVVLLHEALESWVSSCFSLSHLTTKLWSPGLMWQHPYSKQQNQETVKETIIL